VEEIDGLGHLRAGMDEARSGTRVIQICGNIPSGRGEAPPVRWSRCWAALFVNLALSYYVLKYREVIMEIFEQSQVVDWDSQEYSTDEPNPAKHSESVSLNLFLFCRCHRKELELDHSSRDE